MASKVIDPGTAVGSGVIGAIIAAAALIIVGAMKLRGTFLGHLITRNAHLEGLLREDRKQHEADMSHQRDFYEARIKSICAAHEVAIREVRKYYDREITAVRREVHELREQMLNHDSERGRDQ